LAAISGMRLSFAPASPPRRPFAKVKPEPPAAMNAGINNRKPHGMTVLTAATIAWDANSSERAVEIQKVVIVRSASAPAIGWIVFNIFLPFPLAYATQMPGTETFWNRCGEATAEDG